MREEHSDRGGLFFAPAGAGFAYGVAVDQETRMTTNSRDKSPKRQKSLKSAVTREMQELSAPPAACREKSRTPPRYR